MRTTDHMDQRQPWSTAVDCGPSILEIIYRRTEETNRAELERRTSQLRIPVEDWTRLIDTG